MCRTIDEIINHAQELINEERKDGAGLVLSVGLDNFLHEGKLDEAKALHDKVLGFVNFWPLSSVRSLLVTSRMNKEMLGESREKLLEACLFNMSSIYSSSIVESWRNRLS